MFTQPWCLLCGIVLAVVAQGPGSSPAGAHVPQETFVGAWRLVSVETLGPKGEISYPFYGKHPEGLLVYDASGWMSVQIVSDPAPTLPRAGSREEMLRAPVAEKASALEGYLAYFGTWTVDEAKATVTHHIRQSLYPAERGEDGVRHFVFDGDRLTLTAKTREMGEEHERRLVWERLRRQP